MLTPAFINRQQEVKQVVKAEAGLVLLLHLHFSLMQKWLCRWQREILSLPQERVARGWAVLAPDEGFVFQEEQLPGPLAALGVLSGLLCKKRGGSAAPSGRG